LPPRTAVERLKAIQPSIYNDSCLLPSEKSLHTLAASLCGLQPPLLADACFVLHVQRVVWRRDQNCAHATGKNRRKWMQAFVDTWRRVLLQANAQYPPPGAPPPLPQRQWKEWDIGGGGSGGGGGSSSSSSSSVCICSFNVLSDDLNEQYSFQFVAPSPFFGNFTLWDYRLPRCVAEVVRSGADVVCLQEIDVRLHACVSSALKSSGYACTAVEPRCRGVVAPKGVNNSAFKANEKMQDGVMIAYKTSAVVLLDSWSEHVTAPPPDGAQPDGCAAAAAAFRLVATGHVFAVVSLHLRPAADAMRCSAMVHLRRRVSERAEKKGGAAAAVFLCGDFNGFPGAGCGGGDAVDHNDEIPYPFALHLSMPPPSPGDAADGIAALRAAGFASACVEPPNFGAKTFVVSRTAAGTIHRCVWRRL
jgi:endonuclease/exonuclease/phosphatase family metal-dependent hydrolase